MGVSLCFVGVSLLFVGVVDNEPALCSLGLFQHDVTSSRLKCCDVI